jgi:hypothetical protein
MEEFHCNKVFETVHEFSIFAYSSMVVFETDDAATILACGDR